jgi:DinB superfamily
MDNLDHLRYPIGRFTRPARALSADARAKAITDIEAAPQIFRTLTTGLSEPQLQRTYRPGGWTIRQVAHHVPDSHMNAYVRMKLAATEDRPLIRVYDEAAWAELSDGRTAPIAMSLDLLEALHARWTSFLRGLPAESFLRVYVHPELGEMTIDQGLALYSWHGAHHAAHIRNALGSGT